MGGKRALSSFEETGLVPGERVMRGEGSWAEQEWEHYLAARCWWEYGSSRLRDAREDDGGAERGY